MSNQKKTLCLASFIRIVTSCVVKPRKRYNDICKLLLLSLCDSGVKDFSYTNTSGSQIYYIGENYSKIHRNGQNLPPAAIQMAEAKSYDEYHSYICLNLVPIIEEAKKKNLILALVDTIAHDPSIPNSTEFGHKECYSKEQLLDKSEFVLSEFLTDIFMYSLLKADNLQGRNFARTIDKDDYSSQFDSSIAEITLLNESPVIRSQNNSKSNRIDQPCKIPQIIPPSVPDDFKEKDYVTALIEAYNDADGSAEIKLDNLRYTKFADHFRTSRRNFYSAESLKEGTKDLFTEEDINEFELLKDDIYDGVIYTYHKDFEDGFARCNEIMTSAAQVEVQSTRMFIDNGWLGTKQKQGVCHFLVNEGRLNGWVIPND